MLTRAPQYFREFVIIGTCEDNSFDLALLESLGVLWVVKANHLNAQRLSVKEPHSTSNRTHAPGVRLRWRKVRTVWKN